MPPLHFRNIKPNSRESIHRLIQDLIVQQQAGPSSSVEDAEDSTSGENQSSSQPDSDSTAAIFDLHRVSEQLSESQSNSEDNSPPLTEVKYNAGQESTEVADDEEMSDSSGREEKKVTLLRRHVTSPKMVNGKDQQSSSSADSSEEVSNSSGDPNTRNTEPQQAKLDSDGVSPSELLSLPHKNSSFGPESSGESKEHPDQPLAKKAKTGSSIKKQPEEKVASIRRIHGMGPKTSSVKVHQSSSSTETVELSKRRKKDSSDNSSEDSGYIVSNYWPEESEHSSEQGSEEDLTQPGQLPTKKAKASSAAASAVDRTKLR